MWHQNRKYAGQALEILKELVKYTICESKQIVYLPDMRNLYEPSIRDIGGNASRLEAKMIKPFGDRICVVKVTIRKGKLSRTQEILLRLPHENNILKISTRKENL